MISYDVNIDALLSGNYWHSGNFGSFVTITWSFGSMGDAVTRNDRESNVLAFPERWKSDFRSVVAEVDYYTGVQFVEVAYGGDIRVGVADIVLPAHTYYPSDGDMWFQTSLVETYDSQPDYRRYQFMHELGHALGLKHSFEGPLPLPASLDNTNVTVMAYPSAAIPYPSAYNPLDIAALQFVYGGTVGTSAGDLLTGSAASETIQGFDGGDVAYGKAGDDTISGNRGTDYLSGNQGADRLYGGQDSDTLFGGQQADLVYGNLGADLMFGNLGDDLLFGGQSGDTVYGGQGNDTLNGGLGDDLLAGNLGADIFVFGTSSGRDTIVGYSVAQGDVIEIGSQTYAIGTAADGSAFITLSGGGTITVAGLPPSTFV